MGRQRSNLVNDALCNNGCHQKPQENLFKYRKGQNRNPKIKRKGHIHQLGIMAKNTKEILGINNHEEGCHCKKEPTEEDGTASRSLNRRLSRLYQRQSSQPIKKNEKEY